MRRAAPHVVAHPLNDKERTMKEFELLDSEQVAHLLGTSVRTVWRLVQVGKLPDPIRFNSKLVRWDGGTLRRWMLGHGMEPMPTGSVLVPPSPPRQPPAPGEVKRVYTTKTLARLLQVTISTVYRRAKELGLEKRGVGRGYAISDSQMDELFGKRVLPGPAEPVAV